MTETADDLSAPLGQDTPRRKRRLRLPFTGTQLLAVLRAPELAQADAELAALVRSAAVPGLKQRIDAYRHPAGAGQAGTASAPTQRS